MADALQQQLDRLMSLFLEEQAANRAHREEMQSRMDALSSGGSGQGESRPPPHFRYQGHASGSNGRGVVPRFAKLDFPKFSGADDPLGWLSRCEHFFNHQSTAEDDKVGLASYHLEGNAQLWFIQLLADYPHMTWEAFKHQCNLRFGPPIRSNKLGELAKLKQCGSVAEYQTQFEILVARAGSLTQLQKVQLYMSGLQEDIAVEVELHHPPDLASAMSISRLYERRGMDMAVHPPENPTPVPKPAGHTIRRLTHEEMVDRRRQGLCFNCDEPFTRGHRCAKLFWLELSDSDPPDRDPSIIQGT